MRGRFCTQPFLVERSACRPNAFLLPLRWVSRSPPHLPQCAHWGTFPPRGRLWVEKNPASQTSGPRKGRNKIQSVFCTDTRRAKNSSHPESASFAGAVRGASPNFGSPAQRVPKFLPFPARPAGGRAVTGVGQMGRRPGKKRRRTPAGSPQTRKGGSREEEPLPPWCSFLRLSSKESRAPARGRAGNGALRPKVASELPTRRVRRPAPRPPHRGR